MSNTYHLFRHHLKSERKRLGLSLQLLSEHSGVSKSLISKIERSEIQPSIKTAASIADGLGVSLSDMFREKESELVIYHPADEQFTLNNGDHHIRKKMTPMTAESEVSIFHEHLNADSILDALIHADASKFILAVNGSLSIIANEIEYALSKGDCLYISSNVEHSIHNEDSSQVNFITILQSV